MHCKECDAYIPASSKFCSECGNSTSWGSSHGDSNPYPTPQAGTDSTCVGSAIAGVIALLFPLFGVTGVIAIVCGVKGRSSADETGAGGRGLATLGIVLGFLSLLRMVLGFLTLASMTR